MAGTERLMPAFPAGRKKIYNNPLAFRTNLLYNRKWYGQISP